MSKDLVKRFLRNAGYEIIRKRPDIADILHEYGFRLVLDVGANVGQFGRSLVDRGYRGRIVSFEPVSKAFEELRLCAQSHLLWEAVHIALGGATGDSIINVSRSSVYSSLLEESSTLLEFDSNAWPVTTETVHVETIDAVFEQYRKDENRTFLKIDTQGYEKEVILGARESLRHIEGVQIEASLSRLYKGEPSLSELLQLLEDRGFDIVLVEPVTYDRRRVRLLQIDVILLKRGLQPVLSPFPDDYNIPTSLSSSTPVKI